MFTAIKKLFFPSRLSSQYEILSKLGSGGFGKVYLARRKRDNKRVAVKKIKKRQIREYVNASVGEVLPLEIYMSLSLSHPNIIHTCGYLQSGNSWCLEMEHCEGYMDLTSFIQLNSSLSHQTSRKILLQTYRALTFCFRQNIAHRDVKTDNILVHWSTHQVKLIDFGVSCYVSPNSQITDNRGTDFFMPPEFFSRYRYDPLRGTVWALGCLLYCMLFGEVPFLSVGEIVHKAADIPEVNPSTASPSARACLHLLERSLEKDEEGRISYRDISMHPWLTDMK